MRKAVVRFKNLLKCKKGSESVEMLVSSFWILAIFIVCISLLMYIGQAYTLNYACRRVVRSIEVTGIVDSTTYDLEQELTDSDLVVTMSVDADYFDASAGEIQLRDTFSVTLTTNYKIVIAMPLTGNTPITVNIPIKSKVTGMSEIYWK